METSVPLSSSIGLKMTFCNVIGCDIREYPSLISTNSTARSLASQGAREGTVVIALEQTGGRGRNGRNWSSPSGGLYLSVILRPPPDVEGASAIPLLAGLAVSKAISTSCGISTSLKWPNDVLIGDRKVCGILSESSFKGESLEFIIVGIGINVRSFLEPPTAGNYEATSLEDEGSYVELKDLTTDLLYILDMLYGRFLDGGIDTILGEWTDRSSTIGKEVSVETPTGIIGGTAVGLDGSGALVLKQDRRLTIVHSGDCLHLDLN
ncbi:MAG: biotin--[acetyl-CoA-carboxylase] ligase [Candidatus Thermoplasmatota archaeon]|nr:biotin--[acetyl-CoA-carboxylase] ligase [Candidatus Thermoplasmatota archaeon]